MNHLSFHTPTTIFRKLSEIGRNVIDQRRTTPDTYTMTRTTHTNAKGNEMNATKTLNEIANASFTKAVRHIRTDGPISLFGIADHLAEQAADVDGANCDAVAAVCLRMAVERNIVTVETIDGVDYVSPK